MNIKQRVFANYGVPVERGVVCRTPDEAVEAYKNLGVELAVVKAQVHTGGRGKAGGVKLGKNAEEIRTHASNILGMDIKGFIVDRILLCAAVDIKSEYSLVFFQIAKQNLAIFMISREAVWILKLWQKRHLRRLPK